MSVKITDGGVDGFNVDVKSSLYFETLQEAFAFFEEMEAVSRKHGLSFFREPIQSKQGDTDGIREV